MKVVLIVAFLISVVSSSPAYEIKLTETSSAYRLRKSFKPTQYNIYMSIPEEVLTTPANNVIFTAATGLFVDWINKTDREFQFHADTSHLHITKITLAQGSELDFDPKTKCNLETQICSVTLPEELPGPDKDRFQLTFLSDILISTDMLGLYKGSYVTNDGTTEYFLATQFESTYARRVFPCLDEPSFKAKFNLFITPHSSDFRVLTNSVNKDFTFVSPEMPTYSVAFVISKFTSYEVAVGKDGTIHRIWSKTDLNKYRNFALTLAPKIMDEFGDYLKTTYFSFGINKSDEVALPTVDGGAMENWGLITFSEQELLFNEEENSTISRLAIIETMVHEMAHMWFGNWVTLSWWDALFLNEGFAYYFQYFTTHKLYPEYELDKQFVVDVSQRGLEADAKSNTKALQSPCDSVAEINSKFDDISYFKGASIIKMVRDTIGEDKFQERLQGYVKKNRNVSPSNLWKELQIDDIMNEWTALPGFPLIQVKSSNNKTVELSQTNFQTGEVSNWTIPVYIGTSENYLLFKDKVYVIRDEEHKWLYLRNYQGFYRVNYDDQLWSDLIEALSKNDPIIDDLSKSQIVDDIFALGLVRKLPYSKVFDYLEFLNTTDNYYVWVPAFRGFEYLLKRMGEDSKIGQHITSLIRQRMSNIDITNQKSGLDVIKNSLKFEWLCRTGNKDAIKLAQSKFDSFLNDQQPKEETDLREVVFCYGQSSNDWLALFNKYKKSKFSKRMILKSLACGSKNQQSTLLDSTRTEDIPSQDKHIAFLAVLKRNVDLALNFFTKNANEIEKNYSPSSISSIIHSLADALTSQNQINQLEKAKRLLSADSQKILSKSLEMAKENLKWSEITEKELIKYFGISSATSFSFNLWLVVLIFIIGRF